MQNYYLEILLNHSILLPAVTGIIRRRSIWKSFYPFLLFIWLGCLNETLSLVFVYTIGHNAANGNLYVLLEYFILLYQFYTWSEHNKNRFLFLVVLGISVWLLDNVILHSLSANNSIFRSYYSFVILLYSIDRINATIFLEQGSLLRNSVFLICFAFLFYYGYKTFAEIMNVFDLQFSKMFYRRVWLTLSVLNCISNLIFTLAIAWIPRKQPFTLLY